MEDDIFYGYIIGIWEIMLLLEWQSSNHDWIHHGKYYNHNTQNITMPTFNGIFVEEKHSQTNRYTYLNTKEHCFIFSGL